MDADALKLLGPPPVITTSAESLEAAEIIQERSGRRIDSTPVRKIFVRSLDGAKPPMATLYAGGRSGVVPIKLYLALLWRSSSPPYTTDKSSRGWATLLDLEDPDDKGSKRIRAALKTLASGGFVRLDPNPGGPPTVTVLDESGTGKEYDLPSTSYAKTQRSTTETSAIENPNLYFKVPSALWTEGYMQSLTGPGLVMLLILLAERANQKPAWFSTEEFPARYSISSGTRTKGTKELQKLDLLTTMSVPLPKPGGDVYDPRRRRYLYSLVGPAALTSTTPDGTSAMDVLRQLA